MPSVIEICAGAGGQAWGLHEAGFELAAAVEIDPFACETLRRNGNSWRIIEGDVRDVKGAEFKGVTLLAGGVPCPPFSVAGKQLGRDDSRDLFPEALRLIDEIRPEAVMLENVRGFASLRFEDYRKKLLARLRKFGYEAGWRVLNACDFGLAQLRPRFVLVALKPNAFERFIWPESGAPPPTVGRVLRSAMAADGWPGAAAWAQRANGIGPTLVGGSKLHGGPDLGPTRAREQWAALGVDGRGIADNPPSPEHSVHHIPRLTVSMAARLQGFPKEWKFSGGKTAAYRQVGNAFPPPVARAVGTSIIAALEGELTRKEYQLVAGGQMRLFEHCR